MYYPILIWAVAAIAPLLLLVGPMPQEISSMLKIWSYVLSTIHALTVSYMGTRVLLDIPFTCDPYSDAIFVYNSNHETAEKILVIFDWSLGYLVIDLVFVFLLFKKKDMIIHHLIGILGVFICNYTGYGYLLGLYFLLTEISTPLLNLCHLYRSQRMQHTIWYKLAALLLVTTFFAVRIFPIPYIVMLCYYSIPHLPVYVTALMCMSVPVVCALNIWWFYRLLKIGFSKRKQQ